MRCLSSTLLLLWLVIGCRSTVKPNPTLGIQAPALSASASTGKVMPLALGEGYTCMLNRKGQGTCLGAEVKVPPAPASWQTLRAAGSTPTLRNLVAQATVTCAVAVKPPSLENRVLCWQPQTAQTPGKKDQDVILMSGKMPGSIRSLALQKDKVCALFADGQVGCAQLSTSDPALKISLMKGLKSIRQLRAGESFSCAVRGDTGAIFCWGDNSQGQLGLGSSARAEVEPVAIAGFSGYATTVGVGTHHACAINSAGEVLCWGVNSDQQLAGEGEKQLEPQVVRGLPAKAESLALGAKHSCAQLVDGSVWCWGARDALGSDTQGGLIPVRVPLPVSSASLVASPNRSCSQLTTGEFYCWGIELEIFPVPAG